ncbi:MAG: histidine phosphatase family protein [Pseudomonadota bacterium]|jgi:phosphohistidine phosphatase
MLRLAILRHAEAVPLTDESDAERELTPGGWEMAEKMGRYFRDSGLRPDLAWVSPAKRAKETFAGLERGAGETFAVDYMPRLYSADLRTLEDVVTEAPTDAKFLLIVGHNPGLAELAHVLAGHGNKAELVRMRGHFPAPALAVIDFDVDTWQKARRGGGQLEHFVPRQALAK